MVITSAKEKRKESVKTLKLRTKHFHTQDDIVMKSLVPTPSLLAFRYIFGVQAKKNLPYRHFFCHFFQEVPTADGGQMFSQSTNMTCD